MAGNRCFFRILFNATFKTNVYFDRAILTGQKENVKDWYNGFTFGRRKDIYNPWSIINYLDKQILTTYRANTSSNSLVGKLIREGSADIKVIMETLLSGGTFHTRIDEQIVFSQLDSSENAVWSLLLATGYLRVEQCILDQKKSARNTNSHSQIRRL